MSLRASENHFFPRNDSGRKLFVYLQAIWKQCLTIILLVFFMPAEMIEETPLNTKLLANVCFLLWFKIFDVIPKQHYELFQLPYTQSIGNIGHNKHKRIRQLYRRQKVFDRASPVVLRQKLNPQDG